MYTIVLEDKIIGKTKFEYSDATMGVVFGNIETSFDLLDYEYIKTYCTLNNVKLIFDDYSEKMISTEVISQLKVFNSKKIEIKGEGNNIEGSDGEGYTITILGIPHPFFGNEFPNHVK